MEERPDRGSETIGGTPFSGHGRPSRSFPEGRVCAEPDCETRLSIYNDGSFCCLHEPQSTPRLRGKKIA